MSNPKIIHTAAKKKKTIKGTCQQKEEVVRGTCRAIYRHASLGGDIRYLWLDLNPTGEN